MQAPDAARRALQDYTSMHGYFTQSVWDILLAANKPVSERSEALFQHLFTLGLRNPSESTLGMMTGLLHASAALPSLLLATDSQVLLEDFL